MYVREDADFIRTGIIKSAFNYFVAPNSMQIIIELAIVRNLNPTQRRI